MQNDHLSAYAKNRYSGRMNNASQPRARRKMGDLNLVSQLSQSTLSIIYRAILLYPLPSPRNIFIEP
jgi:hypothetical protein